jgi:hypothetical protein
MYIYEDINICICIDEDRKMKPTKYALKRWEERKGLREYSRGVEFVHMYGNIKMNNLVLLTYASKNESFLTTIG